MPTPKLFVKQFQLQDKRNKRKQKTYMFFRYWDNHNNNYEYQVYELVIAKKVARAFGAPEQNGPNTKQMCDWVWENVDEYDGVYREGTDRE